MLRWIDLCPPSKILGRRPQPYEEVLVQHLLGYRCLRLERPPRASREDGSAASGLDLHLWHFFFRVSEFSATLVDLLTVLFFINRILHRISV